MQPDGNKKENTCISNQNEYQVGLNTWRASMKKANEMGTVDESLVKKCLWNEEIPCVFGRLRCDISIALVHL